MMAHQFAKDIIMINNLSRYKRKKSDVVFKIDQEKTYDKVEWLYLQQFLIDHGFLDNVVKLIMMFVSSTTSMCILWNRSRSLTFFPKWGLRQGDPLSPYLFILCMEILGDKINVVVVNGDWALISLSRGGPSLSRLFFVDDVFLFLITKPSKVSVDSIGKWTKSHK